MELSKIRKVAFNVIEEILASYHQTEATLRSESDKFRYSKDPIMITIDHDKYLVGLEHRIKSIDNTLDKFDDQTIKLIEEIYFDQVRSSKRLTKNEIKLRQDFFDEFALEFGIVDFDYIEGINANESKRTIIKS